MNALTPDEIKALRAKTLPRAKEFWAIADAVAAEFGVRTSQITSTQRGNETVCEARAWICRIAHGRGYSLPAIGRYLHRDHTSVLHAIRQTERDDRLVFRSVRGAGMVSN